MELTLQSVNFSSLGDRIGNEHVKVIHSLKISFNILFLSLNEHELYLMCNFGFQGLATTKKNTFIFNKGAVFFKVHFHPPIVIKLQSSWELIDGSYVTMPLVGYP
jgi:hypothetical protein